MKLINFDALMRGEGNLIAPTDTILHQIGIPQNVVIDTNDFSRRTMSQCLTADYCRGWNDCYDAIMQKLKEMDT